MVYLTVRNTVTGDITSTKGESKLDRLILTREERKSLYLRLLLRLVLTVVALLAAVLLLPHFLSLLGPFVAAFITAALLNPLVRWLNEKIGASRKALSLVVVIIIFAIVLTLVGWGLYSLLTEVMDFALNWQENATGITDSIKSIGEKAGALGQLIPDDTERVLSEALESCLSWLQEGITQWTAAVISNIGNISSSVAGVVLACAVYAMAAYFVTADYPAMRGRMSKLVGGGSSGLTTLKIAASSALGGYFKAQMILSGCVFVILFIAMFIWGQSYAVLIALGTAIIDFIPFFGSGIVLVPWAVFSLLAGNYSKAIFLAILALGLFLIRKFAEPKVVGDQTGLSPLTSLICIYVGMKLGGVIGMIIAPVVCMIFCSLWQAGVFVETSSDIKKAVRDVRGFLSAKRL